VTQPGSSDRGRAAENAAERHLKSTAGLALVQRNFRWRGGEVDLVMRDGDTLVFVEVRYRGDERHGGAFASVDRHKQRRIITTAERYLQQHRQWARLPCRFDVVGVSGDDQAGYRCQWLRAAFDAGHG